jgi:serine/threonine protein kinase
LAPEIKAGEGYAFESECYQLGHMMYKLLFGAASTALDQGASPSLKFPSRPPISLEAEDLIRKLLEAKPSRRIKLDEIASHEFLTKNKVP